MKIFIRISVVLLLCGVFSFSAKAQPRSVSPSKMKQVYEEVRAPYKYGLVLIPEGRSTMVDCPSVFRYGKTWYMTYLTFDGQGYETRIAKSTNLLQWEDMGKILSFTENTWDANQKAGYIALQNHKWGDDYKVQKYKKKYWMSYLGGAGQGYEAGMLGIGMAYTQNLIEPKEWDRQDRPVIFPTDGDARWYDDVTIYKSSIIYDKKKTLGHPFVMYYNGNGKDKIERIAMAVSDDMEHWKRYGTEPVVDHQKGITGDAVITKMDDLWVMFYFGAFWKPGAFDRFACSYDLVNWTTWDGDDLISSSETYDDKYAHKPFVLKHDGIVYHFYCAVNKQDQRGIAVATSKDLGKSVLEFPEIKK